METSRIRRFRRFLRGFERVTNAQLKNCCAGVTLAQCCVLLEIDENGRLTMGQLASRLRLDNSTLSRTIDGLVGRGLVERLREDRDRRVVRIQLTQEGAGVCRAIHGENDLHCCRVLEKIPPAERDEVLRCFETLVQAFLDSEAESVVGDCAVPASSESKKEVRS